MISLQKREIVDPNMFITVTADNLHQHENYESKYKAGEDIFDWSKTSISLKKVTENEVMQETYNYTAAGDKDFKVSDYFAYQTEHSPDRTQWFLLGIKYLPNFASVHKVRHDKFAYHFENFVKTGREDREGLGFQEHRYSSKDHAIMINSAELRQIAEVRLCQKAHPDVRFLTLVIRELVEELIPELAYKMVPSCVKRGYCKEDFLSCKKIDLMHERYARDFFKGIKPYCLPTNREKYLP